VALQRHNALFLSGSYDRYVADLAQTAHHDGSSLKPLDIARLAYIERVRGHRETARRLMDDIARIAPDDVPWTHRSLYTYQLVELKLLDGDTEQAARLARTLVPRINRAAVSPTTGAFESLDAVVRAFLAEAARQRTLGNSAELERLVEEARQALNHIPRICPPLFAGRLLHDRAIVSLARGRRAEALKLFEQAEAAAQQAVVPCFRMRLLEDLLEVYDAGDPRRERIAADLQELADVGKLERRVKHAPWLWR
jgi:hypothetical protein